MCLKRTSDGVPRSPSSEHVWHWVSNPHLHRVLDYIMFKSFSQQFFKFICKKQMLIYKRHTTGTPELTLFSSCILESQTKPFDWLAS